MSCTASSVASCFLLLAGVASLAGCADVRFGAPETQDQVVGTTHQRVLGSAIRAQAWQQGTELRVRAVQQCDLVEYNEIHRTTIREPTESHEVEWVVLGASAIPLTTGVIMLADSSAVYEEDRNAREYNPVGPSGAIAGGVILLVAGTILAVVPTVELIRTSGTEVEESVVHEQGRVLRPDVACERSSPARGTPVRGRLSNLAAPRDQVHVPLGTTDDRGELVVDLAEAIDPAVIAGPGAALSMELWVGERMVGLIDLAPVRRAHQAQAAESSAGAGDAVLQPLPEAPGPAPASPSTKGEGRAAEEARDAARLACKAACEAGCNGQPECIEACMKEACP